MTLTITHHRSFHNHPEESKKGGRWVRWMIIGIKWRYEGVSSWKEVIGNMWVVITHIILYSTNNYFLTIPSKLF
jgi:hypothetical protein